MEVYLEIKGIKTNQYNWQQTQDIIYTKILITLYWYY